MRVPFWWVFILIILVFLFNEFHFDECSYLMSSILIWVFHCDEYSILMNSFLIWMFLFNELHFDNMSVPFWWNPWENEYFTTFLFDMNVPFDNMRGPFWWVFLLMNVSKNRTFNILAKPARKHACPTYRVARTLLSTLRKWVTCIHRGTFGT